ncbi:cytochrome P450 [Dactylonectria estremocensis]|uniref:Cytochrome P450 n=1 Tax=Dactylonectria estremocensis TaxID=1079267 RepID=A0A9P9D3H3_9HYPO|nr:cytochrome P450 [Dactylonectria estremocensis]
MTEHLIFNFLPSAIGFFTVILALSSLYQITSSPLREVPGPFLARFSNIWYFFHVNRGEFEKDNLALHRRYGPIVRYGPNRYSFSHVDAAQAIYSIGAGSRFVKSPWYRAFESPIPNEPDLFSDANIQRHAQRRRKYQSVYSLSSMVSYEAFVNECADIFDQRLREMASDKATGKKGWLVDMGHWFQCYAFDVIGMITYSKRLGFLDDGADIGDVIAGLEWVMKMNSLAGIYPWMHTIASTIVNWLPSTSITGLPFIVHFTQQCITAHQAQPKAMIPEDGESEETMDFLTKLLARHRRDPTMYNKWYAMIGCAQNMAAGSDTTGISLSATLYYLLKYPRTMEKLRQEVDERVSPSQNISFKDSQSMPYLQAVIKEALRLHPATGLPLERVVPDGGATICNQFFPAGTIVGINTWVEHQNEQIYGPDAAEFRPERWLVDDKGKIAFMNRHWMPFGLGSRTCIGRHVSYLEMLKLIPRIVRDFDFELADELKHGSKSWKTNNYWFVKPKDLNVNVRVRSF